MTLPFRFLADAGNSTAVNNSSSSLSETESIDSASAFIIAALLCAFISVLGLVAVARCAWARRYSLNTASAIGERPSNYEQRAAANKGLKKKILRSLPILTYSAELAEKFTECPICLTDFATGDDVRVLPQCGHGFHVGCIDTWLGSHSSCPSCRQILLASSRCQNCGGGGGGGGGNSTLSSCRSHGGGAEREVQMKEREDIVRTNYEDNRFLP